MDKNFAISFDGGYDTADTLIQIDQLEELEERLETALSQKQQGEPFDMLLLKPAFFAPIKESKPGYNKSQVEHYVSPLKRKIEIMQKQLSEF